MDILELQDQLEQQAAWRKRELFQARQLASSAENDSDRDYLCRVWVLMLYAHCDNFLKETSKHYLKFLKQNKNKKYKIELVWFIVMGKDVLLDSPDQYKNIDAFSEQNFYDLLDEKLISSLYKKKSFDYGFLRFICDWVLQINFEHKNFEPVFKVLKNRRNSIAHGEKTYIDVETSLHWDRRTIEFIDSLKDCLIEHARKA
jgi:hypothetical protein